MNFKNGVINIQAAGYNGTCTVSKINIFWPKMYVSLIDGLHCIGQIFSWHIPLLLDIQDFQPLKNEKSRCIETTQ